MRGRIRQDDIEGINFEIFEKKNSLINKAFMYTAIVKILIS